MCFSPTLPAFAALCPKIASSKLYQFTWWLFPVILLHLNHFFVFGWPKELKGNASMFCFILFKGLFVIYTANVKVLLLMSAVYIGVLCLL